MERGWIDVVRSLVRRQTVPGRGDGPDKTPRRMRSPARGQRGECRPTVPARRSPPDRRGDGRARAGRRRASPPRSGWRRRHVRSCRRRATPSPGLRSRHHQKSGAVQRSQQQPQVTACQKDRAEHRHRRVHRCGRPRRHPGRQQQPPRSRRPPRRARPPPPSANTSADSPARTANAANPVASRAVRAGRSVGMRSPPPAPVRAWRHGPRPPHQCRAPAGARAPPRAAAAKVGRPRRPAADEPGET